MKFVHLFKYVSLFLLFFSAILLISCELQQGNHPPYTFQYTWEVESPIELTTNLAADTKFALRANMNNVLHHGLGYYDKPKAEQGGGEKVILHAQQGLLNYITLTHKDSGNIYLGTLEFIDGPAVDNMLDYIFTPDKPLEDGVYELALRELEGEYDDESYNNKISYYYFHVGTSEPPSLSNIYVKRDERYNVAQFSISFSEPVKIIDMHEDITFSEQTRPIVPIQGDKTTTYYHVVADNFSGNEIIKAKISKHLISSITGKKINFDYNKDIFFEAKGRFNPSVIASKTEDENYIYIDIDPGGLNLKDESIATVTTLYDGDFGGYVDYETKIANRRSQ